MLWNFPYYEKKMIVFDLDDFMTDGENNCMDRLLQMKEKYPKLKVTLFTILGRSDSGVIKDLQKYKWIEFAAHGYYHYLNDEVLKWDSYEWENIIDIYNENNFTKLFKAPNWDMNMYGYLMLKNNGWTVAVRKDQIKGLPEGMRYYCFETTPHSVHGHTWLLEDHEKKGWFKDWNKDSEFEFVSNFIQTN